MRAIYEAHIAEGQYKSRRLFSVQAGPKADERAWTKAERYALDFAPNNPERATSREEWPTYGVTYWIETDDITWIEQARVTKDPDED